MAGRNSAWPIEKLFWRNPICATPALAVETLREHLSSWQWDRVVVSSVVPDATATLRDYFGPQMLQIRHDAGLGIGIRYPKPETIGADRLANAVALARLYGAPGIVIDFGTAVTFDIVSADAATSAG